MAVVLARLYQTADGMFGSFSFNAKPLCVTVERPWLNNRPKVSCIPPGDYSVTRFKSPKNGDCFLLHDVQDRSMIEIHHANVAAQLQGCIAPGRGFTKFSQFNDAQGVTFSKLTMQTLRETLPPEFTLTILNPN